MDISEIKAAKFQCEAEIERSIRAFEEKCGVVAAELEFIRTDITNIGDHHPKYAVSVRLIVSID